MVISPIVEVGVRVAVSAVSLLFPVCKLNLDKSSQFKLIFHLFVTLHIHHERNELPPLSFAKNYCLFYVCSPLWSFVKLPLKAQICGFICFKLFCSV